MLGSQEDKQDVLPLQFKTVDEFTTFRAEYAFDGVDIVTHFFRTPEHETDDNYWVKTTFPEALEKVAIAHFDATYPRIAATYTKEVDSWWLRAYGFANIGDPDLKMKRLFEKLDQALEATKVSQRPV